MDWTQVLEIFGVIGGIATIFGLFLAPMFWLGAKIDALTASLHSTKEEMSKEAKDFHGRLCAIEERNKKV